MGLNIVDINFLEIFLSVFFTSMDYTDFWLDLALSVFNYRLFFVDCLFGHVR